jgi:hypothetical protein
MSSSLSSLGLVVWIVVIGLAYRKLILSHSGKSDCTLSERRQPERPMFENVIFRHLRRRRESYEIKVTRH